MLALLNQVIDPVVRYIKDEDRGAGMVEYALLVVLIALIAFIAIQFAGNQVSTVFSNVGNSLSGTATN